MATVNLSEERAILLPEIENHRVVILVSRWNEEVTENLYNGAMETLLRLGFQSSQIEKEYVPGSFELPLGAKWATEKAGVTGVIALGCIVRGETPHFEYGSMATAQGIQDIGLHSGKPVVFGVLTDDHIEQNNKDKAKETLEKAKEGIDNRSATYIEADKMLNFLKAQG